MALKRSPTHSEPEKSKQHGFELELLKTSFFLTCEIVVPMFDNGITPLQKRIFVIMGEIRAMQPSTLI